MTQIPATLLHPMGSMGEPIQPEFWNHDCRDEGRIAVGHGQPCNWCGAFEHLARTRGVHGCEPWDHSVGEAA